MVNFYRGQFFFPFAVKQGTFVGLCKSPSGRDGFKGDWFHRTPDISPHKPDTFAEYQYFHPHARELLFNNRGTDSPSLMVYEVDQELIKGWAIEIEWTRRVDNNEVFCKARVDLDWVVACIYDLDVGCLTFGVKHQPKDGDDAVHLAFGDVLDINNLLRRSAPSFLSHDEIVAYQHGSPTDGWSNAQKGACELPGVIRLVDPSGCEKAFEDFGIRFDEYVLGVYDCNRKPYVGNHYSYWLDLLCNDLNKGTKKAPLNCLESSGSMMPILDERNFVCSFVVVDDCDTGRKEPGLCLACCTNDTQNKFGKLTTESERIRQSLYQYIFVDPCTKVYTSNAQFRDDCLQDSLYLRFRDFGSYYGFTRYSGSYLLHGEYDNDAMMVSEHFNSLYFQMATLAMGNRAILLELSRRASVIAQEVSSTDDFDRPGLHKELEGLRADFLKFHNKYWYSEITGQEQGLEMFSLWSRNMGNERMFCEVEKEIQALHDFSNATVGRRLGSLTYLSIAMFFVSFVALGISSLGAPIFDTAISDWCYIQWVACILGAAAVLAITALLAGKPLIRLLTCLVSWRKTRRSSR